MKTPNPIPRAALASLVLLAFAHVAWSQSPVSILNAGFETPALSEGSYPTTVPDWSQGKYDVAAPGTWIAGAAGAGHYNLSASDYTNPVAPEGLNMAYTTSASGFDTGISQTLAATLQPDATYQLSAKVGNPSVYNQGPTADWRIELLAGGMLLQSATGASPANDASFVTASLSYNSGAAPAQLGQPLQIRLLAVNSASAKQVDFDDVQLTASLANPVANTGGPYNVFLGGQLNLNGSASLPSTGQTLTAWEWDLNNDGTFGDVTGATPAALPETVLSGTWGMVLGTNTVKLRVTDSAAKTSVSQTTVSIVPATAVVYEPFAYSATILNGASGTAEVGLGGTWTANTATGLADNLPWGSLVTRGGGVGNFGAGGNTFGGGRAVKASALAANGLLNDGATLWFSVILGYDSGGNRTNTRLTMVLGDESMSPNNFSYFFPTAGSTGLGVTMGRFSGVNGKLVATEVRDSTFGTGNAAFTTGNVYGNEGPAVYPGSNANRDVRLVVGRITWGAVSDTLDIFLPDQNLQVDLNAPHSTLTVAVNQSGYDTVSFQRGDRVVWDEIRFGATYASVTETGSYWDLNGSTAGSGSATPSGSWNADPNWNATPDGTGGTGAWPSGGTAVFAAGNDATGSYTVTVDGTRDVGGIIAEDGTVSVTGGTALRLTTNGAISVASGLTATISTPFTEDVAGRGLSKSGAGTVILSGDNSGVTGGMILSGGATQFESPSAIAGTGENAVIGNAGTVVFGPGFGAANIPAALADRIVASSPGTIAADHQAATDFDFNTPGLTGAYLGAVGDVTYTGTLTPGGTTYRLGGGGGTLTMGNANALTGANSLLVQGRVVLAAGNDYSGATTVPGGATLRIMGATGTSGISINQPSSVLEIGADGALGAGTLTINGGFGASPTVSAVGTVVTANPVAFNGDFIFGGTDALALGTLTPNGNRTITNNNTAGVLTLGGVTGANRNLTLAGNGNTTINGDLATGTGTLTKNGNGVLILNGANNTYSGNTTVGGGKLLVNGTLADAAGTLTVNANCTLGGTGTIGRNTTVKNTAKLELNLSTNAAGHDKLEIGTGRTLAFEANCALTIASGGGASPGTYTLVTAAGGITGTPAFTVTLPPDWTADPPQIVGNDLVIKINSTGVPSNTFADWIAGYPGVGAKTGFADDPDLDGNGNGLENFFGTDPGKFSAGLVAGALSGNTFTFTHPQNPAPASDVSPAIYRWSKDLTVFLDGGATDGGGTKVDFAAQPDTPSPGITTVTATVTGAGTSRLFVEVGVTQAVP